MFSAPASVPSLSITSTVPNIVLTELVILVIFCFIALLTVSFRINARLTKGGIFYFNDYAIFWAFFWTSVFFAANVGLSVQGTLEHHLLAILDLVSDRLTTSSKVCNLSFVESINCVKQPSGFQLSKRAYSLKFK